LPGTVFTMLLPRKAAMKRFAPVLLLPLIAILPGCNGFITDCTCSIHPEKCYPLHQSYVAPTSPENVIKNMAALYINFDPVEYDSTLATGYVFRFQPSDITSGQPDSLIRAQELSFAENLFINGAGPEVPRATRIRLVLQILNSGIDNRVWHAGWKKYVVQTQLTVTITNQDSIKVTGPAWWYFRQEPEGSGRWRLAEWADQPLSSGRGPGRVFTQGVLAASGNTWGVLHKLYR
jgi:hypothetical protein